MLFNTFNFWVIFPFIFTTYWLIPCKYEKAKKWSMIIISYLLYMNYKPSYALILLAITLITYSGAIYFQKNNYPKTCLIYPISLLVLLPLLIFKYYNFFNNSISHFLNIIGLNWNIPGLNWTIPLGISFFTFQALGYMLDVYYKKIKAEENFTDYILFCSFFPQIASGPISKASELIPQIKKIHSFSYQQAKTGAWFLLWGIFIKLYIADRLGLYVDVVYGHYYYYSGLTCFIASIFYTFQIYCDFCGYSLMAIGIGKMLGYDLVNNFNRPYFAVTITDFWKRWHISLTRWLTTYIYIPLGGNRCSKLRCYFNTISTFLVSGLWHGANWTFVIWGLIHGIIQIIEKYYGIQKNKWDNKIVIIFRILLTFMIVNFAWIFFRMPSIKDAISIINHMFSNHEISFYYASIGDVLLYFSGIFILLLKEIREEYSPSFLNIFGNKHIKWCVYILLFTLIISQGVLDSGSFIYVSF